MAAVEEQNATIQKSLLELANLIRSLCLLMQLFSLLDPFNAPTYATIAAVETEITQDKAELLGLTQQPVQCCLACLNISPSRASFGLTLLPN